MTPNGSASAATPNGLVTLWLPLVFELVAADVHRTSALNGSSPFLQYLQKEKALPFGKSFFFLATPNGLEPSTSSVTGWRANRLHHRAI